MAKVTDIKPRGRTERFTVHLDGRPFVLVDLDLRQKHGLYVDTELDERAQAALKEDADRLAAWDRATRMLAVRGRSKDDLKRRLVQKGSSPAHAEEAAARLARTGLVDDARFAAQFARSKASQGHGARRIAFELARQGVASPLAQAAIAEALGDHTVDADAALERIAERKYKSLARLDAQARARRLTSFLARRGHGMDAIRRVLKQLESGSSR